MPLVSIGDMHLITGTRIIRLASGWVGVHSTRSLVRLVPMEYFYSIGIPLVEDKMPNMNAGEL